MLIVLHITKEIQNQRSNPTSYIFKCAEREREKESLTINLFGRFFRMNSKITNKIQLAYRKA